jgi:hypothetical protein
MIIFIYLMLIVYNVFRKHKPLKLDKKNSAKKINRTFSLGSLSSLFARTMQLSTLVAVFALVACVAAIPAPAPKFSFDNIKE